MEPQKTDLGGLGKDLMKLGCSMMVATWSIAILLLIAIILWNLIC